MSLSTAFAEDPTCPTDGPWLDGHAHLRAISLDLLGVVPNPGDHELLVDGEVPESLIDDWLGRRAFATRASRFHSTLLWNNVSDQRAISNQAFLSSTSGIYWVRTRSDDYRGLFNQHCGDFEATFDANGEIETVDLGEGVVQEGWVEVEPYWSSGTTVKICAFDAQEAQLSPAGTDCSTSASFLDPTCGCGPNLQWCAVGSQHAKVMRAFDEDIDLRVESVALGQRPWIELLTGTTGYVNGPMVDFFRHRTQVPGGVRFTELGVDVDVLPDLAFDEDDTWVEVDLGEHHAGVLTSPGYLLRFQTGRSRADRFYNSFLCQAFQPPDGGLPDIEDPNPSLDLTVRAGCKYCHALLEPASAHWGRWTPSGGGYLDAGQYPAFDATCAECARGRVDCPDYCNRYYVTRALSSEQDPYLGWLRAYEFLEDRHQPNVELGPALLAQQGMVDGRVPRCAAEKAAEWLLGRPVTERDEAWLDQLAADFVSSNWNWPGLVKDIVTSDAYRSVQ